MELVEHLGVFRRGGQLHEELGGHQHVDVNQHWLQGLQEAANDGDAPTSHQLLLVDRVVDDEVLEEGQEAGDWVLFQLPV